MRTETQQQQPRADGAEILDLPARRDLVSEAEQVKGGDSWEGLNRCSRYTPRVRRP